MTSAILAIPIESSPPEGFHCGFGERDRTTEVDLTAGHFAGGGRGACSPVGLPTGLSWNGYDNCARLERRPVTGNRRGLSLDF